MVYPISFLASVLFCYIGEKLLFNRNKTAQDIRLTGRLFLVSAILILVVLAGCRDFTIGTDIAHYGNSVFYNAQNSASLGALLRQEGRTVEFLYLVINYVVAQFAKSPHAVYAVVGIVIYGGFMLGILRYRKDFSFSVTLAWSFYLLMFFASSFNLMRQMMAMAVLFCGSIHILKQNYLRFIPYFITAVLLHQSALLIISVIAAHWLIYHADGFTYKTVIAILLIVLLLFYQQILSMLIDIGFLTEKLQRYVVGSTGFTFSLNPLIQRSVPILIFLVFSRAAWDDIRQKRFFYVMMFADLVLINMRGMLSPMLRVSMYYAMFSIVSYPIMLRKVGRMQNRFLLTVLLVVFFGGIWYYQCVVMGGNEIYPYTSEILGLKW